MFISPKIKIIGKHIKEEIEVTQNKSKWKDIKIQY